MSHYVHESVVDLSLITMNIDTAREYFNNDPHLDGNSVNTEYLNNFDVDSDMGQDMRKRTTEIIILSKRLFFIVY